MFYYGKTSAEIRGSAGAFSGFSPPRLIIEGAVAEFNPWLFHVLTFVVFPLAALFLWNTIKSTSFLVEWEKFAITALFLLLPLNSARHSMTIFMYSFCNLAFYAGWWIFARAKFRYSKLVSLSLFIVSFDTASFIVFSIVPIAMGLLELERNRKDVLTYLRNSLPFLIAPLVYWFVEPVLNPNLDPVRELYYTPKLSGILRGSLLLLPIVISALLGLTKFGWKYSTHRGNVQILSGLTLIWLGVFPYMALGHFANLNSLFIGFVPGASDWDSRHQLLMPLGMAVLVVGLVNYFELKKIRESLVTVLVACTILSATFTHEYYLDSIKTRDVIEELKNFPELENSELVMFDDQATRFNARGRRIRPYEWEGVLRSAFPNREINADVIGLVRCANQVPDYVVTIMVSRGRFRTLLTRDTGISLKIEEFNSCERAS